MAINDKPTSSKKFKPGGKVKPPTVRAVELDDHTMESLNKILPVIEERHAYTLFIGGFIHGPEHAKCDITEHGYDVAEYLTEKTGIIHEFDQQRGLITSPE